MYSHLFLLQFSFLKPAFLINVSINEDLPAVATDLIAFDDRDGDHRWRKEHSNFSRYFRM